MDVLEAGPDTADGVGDGGRGAPPAARPQAPETESPGGILRVFAKDQDTRIKLISDGVAVPDAARMVDIAFFPSPQYARAAAAWCADLLATSKRKADDEGWHSLHAQNVPTLLSAARNHLNVTFAPEVIPSPALKGRGPLSVTTKSPSHSELPSRRAWTRDRVARLGFLAGQGWTAKQIADDPLVMSTPNNVQRQANRFGILLSDGPQGQVTFQLPIATTAVIDRAAAAVNLTRKAFLRQWLIRGAGDPGRYGMVVISTRWGQGNT